MNGRRVKVTRRQLIQAAGSVGVGLVTTPFALAKEPQLSMVAEIFFDSYGSVAFRRALRYAGDDGFVASLPQLLHARTNAPYENIIWNTWFTANSEENVITTPQGNHVVITVHGGGIYGQSTRMEHALRADLNRENVDGLTGQYAAKITDQEARNLLEGKLPEGAEIPIYGFAEFKQGIPDLPVRYGVTLDFAAAKGANNGYGHFEVLQEDPLMIARAGGIEPLSVYIDKAKTRNATEKMGNHHRHNAIDPSQSQCRILKLGGSKDGRNSDGSDQGLGLGYDMAWGVSAGGLVDMARYVAVTPRDASASLRLLDFEL